MGDEGGLPFKEGALGEEIGGFIGTSRLQKSKVVLLLVMYNAASILKNKEKERIR